MPDTPAPTVPPFDYPRTADEWFEQARYVAAVMPEWGPRDDPNTTTIRRIRELRQDKQWAWYLPLLAEYAHTTFYGMLTHLIDSRDPRALLPFEATWRDAPDAPSIHSWTGWHRLCDLCSEGPALLRGG